MSKEANENVQQQFANEHLSNERTLLAWVRTAIGIMVFGFVVVKFSLFVRQMELFTSTKANLPEPEYTGPGGILLIALGALALLFGTWRYHQTQKQLRTGKFAHQTGLIYVFVGILLIICLVIIYYLIKTA